MIKTRFCPSPTGFMHLGNLRTALFSFLAARQTKGQFLLRIEDTDRARSTEEYTQSILFDLEWLGLLWDEGPKHEGSNGPYLQSARQPIYDHYYQKLLDANMAYECYCTEKELELVRKVQQATGQPPRYAGTCRHLSPSEIESKKAQGIQPTLRFSVPSGQWIESTDLVFGTQRFASDDLGDFIIRRADGTAPFLYGNVLDDSLMGVTHIMRGEEHLTNTPRQLLLLRSLGLREPQYGHLPLIMGSDNAKLSKRHGSRNLMELRQQGFLPGALLNYLARLGHHYKQEPGYMSLQQLIEGFAIAQLGNSPARYDEQQLLHWQREAVLRLDDQALLNWVGEEMVACLPSHTRLPLLKALQGNVLFPAEVKTWMDRLFQTPWILEPSLQSLVQSAGPHYWKEAESALQNHGLNLSQWVDQLCQSLQLKKNKSLYLPLRIALTGAEHGPELGHLLPILGAERISERFKYALQLCR